MKKIVFILMALAVVSCQEKESKKGDSGTAKGVKDGTKIIVSTLGDNNQTMPTDTAVVKNESFTLDLPSSEEQTLNSLSIENVRGNMIFIKTNEPLSFTLYKDSLRSSVVSGGKHNELLTSYSNDLKEFGKEMNNLTNQFRNPAIQQNPEKVAEFRAKRQELMDKNTARQQELVENNPNSLVAVMVLSDMIGRKSLPYPEMKKLYDNLSSEMKASSTGKQIEGVLKTASATAVGSKAPGFSAPTPAGETLALKDALGKITLVDFWASWCKPCRVENPNIVRVYKKYHDKGLNIIGVSLDKSKAKWIQAIEADGLAWNQVSNLKFWQDPIARKYNVRSIPAAFLLDENGVIVAKDLRGKALEDKVAELLGE